MSSTTSPPPSRSSTAGGASRSSAGQDRYGRDGIGSDGPLRLPENPRQPREGYDELTDQSTTSYGGGAGLIVYAVVHERQRVIILRLV